MSKFIPDIIIILLIGLIISVGLYAYKESEECKAKGGVLIRSGCIKKEVFINE